MKEDFLKSIVAFIIVLAIVFVGVIGGLYISRHEKYAQGYLQCVKDIMIKPNQQNTQVPTK